MSWMTINPGREAGGGFNMVSLLTLRLSRKRDLLQARQRVRQVARMLGFDAVEQLTLACVVFELLMRQRQRQRRTLVVELVVTNAAFEVRLQPPMAGSEAALLARRPLPVSAPGSSLEDLCWAARQLDHHTPLDLLDEFHHLNNELLRLLLELQRLRRDKPTNQSEPAA